jgi:hypothetical protein
MKVLALIALLFTIGLLAAGCGSGYGGGGGNTTNTTRTNSGY